MVKMCEQTKGEKQLIIFANDFKAFLKTNPKIKYNIHKSLKKIQSEFDFILNFL